MHRLSPRLLELDGLSDEDVATAMTFKRQQAAGTDFLPLHQHRIVAISVTFRTADSFKVWSLGDETSDESESSSFSTSWAAASSGMAHSSGAVVIRI